MIRVRLNTFKSRDGSFEIPIRPFEKLNEGVERALQGLPLDDRGPEEIFQVLVNGYHIHSDLWDSTVLTSEDQVFIAPYIKDDFKSVLRVGLLVAITAITSGYAVGLFGPGLYAGLFTAGVSMSASLLINALIPPPVPTFEGGSGSTNVAESQMYSISSQSNAVRKFQTVPKVYGTHRIFPPVAANPYVTTEVDPNSGELVQYLYAIYDMGYGPMYVSDIRIGDSSITSYSEAYLNIVDTGKPAVDEGTWDSYTAADFRYYKGDYNLENLAVTLDGNRADGDDIASYEVVRQAGLNSQNVEQEITLSMVNSRGLYSYDAQGTIRPRTIDLEILFAKVGTDDWHSFNDLNYVKSFEAVGGFQDYTPVNVALYPIQPVREEFNLQGVYSELRRDEPFNMIPRSPGTIIPGQQNTIFYGYVAYYGYPKGTRTLILKADPVYLANSLLIFKDKVLGRIESVQFSYPGYVSVTLVGALTEDLSLFNVTFPLPVNFVYGPQSAYPLPAEDTPYSYRDGKRFIRLTGYYDLYNKIYVGNNLAGKAKISRAQTGPVYSSFKFIPKAAGEYKVKVIRVSTASDFNSQVSDSLTITSLTTRLAARPINTDKRHVFLELRIKATNQLNGSIGNLSAIASSVLDVWDGAVWKKEITSNPAWIYADLLTGEVNKRSISKSRLHTASLLEWAEFCDEIPDAPPGRPPNMYPRFTCNFILDYGGTLQEVLNQVASASQAGFNVIDGKYGVLVDRLRTVPVQVFTPRNSSGFTSTRNYAPRPDAVNVKYIEPSLDWNVQEIPAYDDGFTADTAEEFDELVAFGATNHEQAWRFGRYMIAQNRLRQETISINVDFEYLVCARGDYVQITQDAMKVGGTPARVIEVNGNQIVIDEGLETSNTINYGYTFRRSTGGVYTNTLTVINSDTFEVDGDIPNEGDLIVIGQIGKITYDCIVKSISPNDDLTASITLVEKADAIYFAESLGVFPDYNPQLSQTVNADFAPPGEVLNLAVADMSYACATTGTGYDYYVDLVWDPPTDGAFEHFEIYVDNQRRQYTVGTTRNNVYRVIIDQNQLGVEHTFWVTAVSASGKKIDLAVAPVALATPSAKTALPSSVAFLATNITNEVIQLSWDKIADCDCQEYLIRFSPNRDVASWQNSIPLLRVDRNVNLASTQARSGVYLIKAVDFAGNESLDPALAITTIPELTNLNIIAETQDFPALNGSFEQTQKIGSVVTLAKKVVGGVETAEYYSEGYYNYSEFLDLGDIFTVRLQSLVQAEGITEEDIMSNWTRLSDVLFLANAGSSDWDVKTEYRATNEFNVIADWTNLSLIDPISEGNQDLFTPWREFIMGDATGRIFQFRLKLISNRFSVTPRVFDGTIKADMPDRMDSYENLTATNGAYELLYDPPFKGPGVSPNIQISIDGAQSGDYWQFDYKDLNGFKVLFYDKNNNLVTRQFDVAIKGFGRLAQNII